MKRIYFTLILILLVSLSAKTQVYDTLKNMAINTALSADKYTSTNWGYYSGHNYLGRQQYAEKYVISKKPRL
ncbi:MAG: hypothetical protein HC831_20140 [Chloroflexia bacterium]|nr:hypothetical protein [Chloroflexia bacterium]